MCSDGCVFMRSHGCVMMCSDGCVLMCSYGCVQTETSRPYRPYTCATRRTRSLTHAVLHEAAPVCLPRQIDGV